MIDKSRSTEETFNFALGTVLRNTSIRWRDNPNAIKVERTGTLAGLGQAGKKPDLLIQDGFSPTFVIESSYAAHDADHDAIERLGRKTQKGNETIISANAVLIPEIFRSMDMASIQNALVQGKRISYALHQLVGPEGKIRRWPTKGYIEGSVQDLAMFVEASVLPKEQIEEVADDVAKLVDQAADILDMALSESQQSFVSEQVLQRTPLKALRTTMVLWLNSLLTQQRLSSQEVTVAKPLDFFPTNPVMPSDVLSDWQKIFDLNWKKIFRPAISILKITSQIDPHSTSRALVALIKAVESIEVNRLGLHINVGAELFPKLSDDQKQAAAFYTQPGVAELLASLVIDESSSIAPKWESPNFFKEHRIADLACGTGTLLRAAYRRVLSLHEITGGTEESIVCLHKDAMETGLVGSDVSPIASHLTSSSLAAIGTGHPYAKTSIGWVRVGESTGYTGSLEYIDTDEVYDIWEKVSGASSGGDEEMSRVSVPDSSIDFILMNPPYSRTRGGQSAFDIAGLTDTERKASQKRWKTLFKNEPVDKRAGMAASFLALARRKVKDGGTIGFVLPLTAAFADVWTPTRKMIEMEFKNIRAIVVAAGQAIGATALSADTHMEEMLLIAEKRLRKETSGLAVENSPIHCILLKNPPIRVGESVEVARAIKQSLSRIGEENASKLPVAAGEEELGHIVVYDAGGQGDPWGPLGVVHPDLALCAEELVNGRLTFGQYSSSFKVSMSTVDELFEVGPTHHLIGHPIGAEPGGAFEFHVVSDGTDSIGIDRALWAADANTQTKLVVEPTHKGMAPKGVGNEDERNRMRSMMSTLLYSRNMRWTSQKLHAATTEIPVLGGSSWTTLQHPNELLRNAYALWFNSTLGMMVRWTRGQRTHPGRSRLQVGALKQVSCPRLDELQEETIAEAALFFKEIAQRDLLPACQAHIDPVRRAIDRHVNRMLGIPDTAETTIEVIRRVWCREPSVHGNQTKALKLLSN